MSPAPRPRPTEHREPEPEPEVAPEPERIGPRLEALVTADETRRAEEAHQGSLDELMERAGTAVARVVLNRFPGRVAVVCGSGNNGGDGRVCARVLREAGRDVTVVEGLGDLGEPDVVVDALLGIGLKEAPREDAARMIERINASGKPVVAIDVPSGVDASTGEVPGAAVRATVTVTFAAAKVGLAIAPGRAHAGSVQVASIGLAIGAHEHALVPATVLAEVPRKSRASTKYRAGSVLVVGGSRGMTGAPMLSALAAFRCDAGYVGIAAPESALPVIESRVLEAVKWPLPEDSAGRALARAVEPILEAAERADAVAVGPGLGRTDGTKQLVRVLLERLDAAGRRRRRRALGARAVRARRAHRPHPAQRRARAPARRDGRGGRRAPARRGSARGRDLRRRRAAQGRGHAGRGAADAACYVASYGQPSLATAGSGDVLTGVIAAFLAKGLEPQLAAAAAAVAHGLASRLVEPQIGLVASDLLPGAPARARRRRLAVAAALRVVRSEITIDLGAVRRNARRLREALGGAELWAVVKANGYGHGAADCARAALDGGATALCVATPPEALALRARAARRADPADGPGRRASPRRARRGSSSSSAAASPRASRSTSSSTPAWAAGASRSSPRPTRDVVGLATHLATADSDLDFARIQIERFREATAPYAHLTRHAANSAATLRLPESHFDAARCGIALYGLSPFGTDRGGGRARARALVASELALVKLLRPATRPATAAASSPSATRGSASSRSATRTASAAT